LRVLDLGEGNSAIQYIRRARGSAPMPLALPEALTPTQAGSAQPPSVFATGPEQKNSFCMTRDGEAFVSQHIGDMENIETFDAWIAAKKRYERLFEIAPQRNACDLHPEYLSSKWAQEQQKAPLEIQHHHAHIASVMAENNLEGPTLGFAFDGTGLGFDKRIWGGEVLICNLGAFERFANFAYVPMPGGAAAIRHPLRMAFGVLWAFDLLEHPAAQKALGQLGAQAEICARMIEKSLNTPLTSSLGRLFDAASAILGICTEPRYEGEGAIMLEAAIGEEAGEDAYPLAILKNAATTKSIAQDTSVLLLDAAPLFKSLLDDMAAGIPCSKIALRFHNTIVQAVLDVCRIAEMNYGITSVALSGGVFMNRYLIERCLKLLPEEGFTVAINRELPPNDGCISYGQAVIALAQLASDPSLMSS
ncbi:MAG: hydrogenase maturation protein HypF, partial [Eggerthellaceae bacterium]|nr:hydrogenase maturation protein HypF [Eggerthellaceae bacterium]